MHLLEQLQDIPNLRGELVEAERDTVFADGGRRKRFNLEGIICQGEIVRVGATGFGDNKSCALLHCKRLGKIRIRFCTWL
jgi:hypothetical protein